MSSTWQEFVTLSTDAIFDRFGTTASGLANEQVTSLRLLHGKNIIKSNEVMWWHVLLRQFRSPFIYLLLAAAGLSFFLGEARDSIFILLFIGINAALGFYQEFKSEQTAKLLTQFIESKAKIMRDGVEVMVPSSELVPGDIVLVSPGDIAAADIRLIDSKALIANESILTGESEAVNKDSTVLKQVHDPTDALNILFGGTSIVSGSGVGIVIATGASKVVGKIATITSEATHESSFEKGIAGFSSFILRVVLVTLVLMIVANVLIKGANINIPEFVLFAVALAVSVIPEALPVVTTFSLSQGARRLAHRKVVVKRLSAIEDLGSISVLCTDKTGTITQNNMSLATRLQYKGADVLLWAALSSGFLNQKTEKGELDSFDAALLSKVTPEIAEDLKVAIRISQVPFDPIRRRSTILIKKNKKFHLISRGSPEEILDLCKNVAEKEKIEKWISDEGTLGRRILAISIKEVDSAKVNLLKEEVNMTFVGLLAYEDPLKETALQAVQKARDLGVALKILTGDRAEVAGAVGVKIGLIEKVVDVITGAAFEKLTLTEKQKAVSQYHVFARMSPVQKYDVVHLLEENYSVGFLGEGINDAPALKAANVGIVVQSGSDIARETADIILLNKSLLTIVEGIEEGRKVFANTIKYIKATLTSNFGNFYAVAISSLFIPFLPMLPIQILLVNLLSDFPMISIATDNVDPEELKSPRNYEIREVAINATILGMVSTVFDFLTFAIFFRLGAAVLQTNWFMESILTELLLIYSLRTKKLFFKAKRASTIIFVLTGIAIPLTIILPFTDFGHKHFQFITPTLSQFATVIAIALCYFVATETCKVFLYKATDRYKAKKK